MKDEYKTKRQLLNELFEMRQQIEGFVTNITEQKQIEEKLKTAAYEWRATFDSTTDLIILLDSKMKVVKANLATTKFLNKPFNEILDKNFSQLFRVNGIPLNVYPFERMKQAKKREEAELYLPERNIWIRISVDPILDDKGNIIRYVYIIRDITGRKQAEEELRESETKYRTLVEQLPAITYTAALDEVSTTLYVSPQIKTFIGYSQEEYQVDPDIWRKRLHPDDHKRVLKEVTKSHANGEPFVSEYRMIAKDGRTVWFRDEALIIRDDAGRPLFLQGVMLDITDRKLAEEKLQAHQEQLRSLASQLSLVEERERRRIATNLHDHISQTLAISKIKLGALRESAPTDLIKSLDEIRNLIEQIIQYTRSLTFELSPPILYDLGFEAAVEWLGEEILKEHGILFHFKNDEQPKPLNDEARVLLFQAVRELLVNIAKHAQAREAKVSIQKVGDDIRINIEDDGIGFDTSKIDFYLRSGCFGLFSIRERLNRMVGYLGIESEPGKGTRIYIIAPLSPKSKNGRAI